MTRYPEKSRALLSRLAAGAEKASVRMLVLLLLGVVTAAAWNVTAVADSGHVATSPAGKEPVEQTECPVMIGNKIDPSIFTTYRDKKVYFCCQQCKVAFAKDPEKYLSRLPQFASSTSPRGHGETADHDQWASLATFTKPMGIVTILLVAATVFLGLFRRLKPKLLLKWHKRVGPAALIVGAIHAAIVLLAHG